MKKKDLAPCGCKKVPSCNLFVAGAAGALLAALVILGIAKLMEPGTYSPGNCFVHDFANTYSKIKQISGDDIIYEYARMESDSVDTGILNRSEFTFKAIYPLQVDCEKFYKQREAVAVHNEAKSWHESVKELHKDLEQMHEKLKNAHRTNQG